MIVANRTTINESMIKKKRLLVGKFQYLRVILKEILIGINMVENYKMSKDEKTFYKCNVCNNTIKITFILHTYKAKLQNG